MASEQVEGPPISRLTDELLMYTLTHITDGSLLVRTSRVCRRWRQVSTDEEIWVSLCARDFAGRQPTKAGQVLGPRGGGETHRQAWMRLHWDRTRLEISKEELCGSNWQLHFHADMFLFHSSPQAAASRWRQGAGSAQFDRNGIFVSSVDGAPSMRTRVGWRLLRYSDDSQSGSGSEASPGSSPPAGRSPSSEASAPSGRVLEVGEGECGTHVQVGSYPILSLARTPDWGWSLTNRFVFLMSLNDADFVPVPRTRPPPYAPVAAGAAPEAHEVGAAPAS